MALQSSNPLRKAAILVATLDQRCADQLLEQLPDEQAARLRRAVMDLDQIDSAEQQHVIQQFLGSKSAPGRATSSGVELAISPDASDSALIHTHVPGTTKRPENQSQSLEYLPRADSKQLFRLLENEHPQTITVVVSQLPPDRAADLVQQLPPPLIRDVLQRLAVLGEADPQMVLEIQQEIGARLSKHIQTNKTRAQGIAALRAIFEASDPQGRRRLIEAMDHQLAGDLGYAAERVDERSSGPLEPATPSDGLARDASANRVPKSSGSTDAGRSPRSVQALVRDTAPELDFRDLTALDDRSLANVFSRAAPEIAMIALAGANPDFVDRILGQLPSRKARRLERQMCQLGPLQLRDVERAQRCLARLAQQLCAEGAVRPRARNPDVTAAA